MVNIYFITFYCRFEPISIGLRRVFEIWKRESQKPKTQPETKNMKYLNLWPK